MQLMQLKKNKNLEADLASKNKSTKYNKNDSIKINIDACV